MAIIGAPNAGKSTLLNRLIGSDVSSASRRAHTTRRNILGVYTSPDKCTQLEFYDSPGLIDKQHMHRHHLESTLYYDPKLACEKCQLIALVVDASDPRETRRLNKGSLQLLRKFSDAEKILVLNKTDRVKEKRLLLDISTRLTQGCLDGRLVLDERNLRRMAHKELRQLNLTGHKEARYSAELDDSLIQRDLAVAKSGGSKFVIDLDKRESDKQTDESQQALDCTTTMLTEAEVKYQSDLEYALNPDRRGYASFSQVFSISALTNDSVDKLRQYLLSTARQVDELPHKSDYLTGENMKDIVTGIIKAKVLDLVDGHAPFVVGYSYESTKWDQYSSLHINMRIHCPTRYLIKMVLGKSGVTISKIVEQSRELISKTFACEVNLSIAVEGPDKKEV